ncbi:MAG: DUF86 domain-containing protein [Cyanobacteria bacterium P01_H01_bin.15]
MELYLQDIIDSIEKIQQYTANLTEDEFYSDNKTIDAVARNLQIIGEAIKKVPPEIRTAYAEIDWRSIAGLRVIITHNYFSVTLEVIWGILQEELSPLKAQILNILKTNFPQ